MYTITTTFHPHGSRLEGRHITAKGLNGLFFNVLEQTNPDGGKWFHEHASPKPYSVVSFYTDRGELAGLRYAAVTEDAAALIAQASEGFTNRGNCFSWVVISNSPLVMSPCNPALIGLLWQTVVPCVRSNCGFSLRPRSNKALAIYRSPYPVMCFVPRLWCGTALLRLP